MRLLLNFAMFQKHCIGLILCLTFWFENILAQAFFPAEILNEYLRMND